MNVNELEKLIAAVCLQPQGGAAEQHHSSVDAPPHDGQRGQQTNHRAGCRGGGGVTQVRVAALEGKTGNLEKINTIIDEVEQLDLPPNENADPPKSLPSLQKLHHIHSTFSLFLVINGIEVHVADLIYCVSFNNYLLNTMFTSVRQNCG